MATQSVKDIQMIITRKLEKQVSADKVNKANTAIGKKSIELWRKQLSDGIDADGKRISKFSSAYSKFKRRFVNGTLKHREKTLTNRKAWYKDLTEATDFRAASNTNYGRLTGKFFSSMSFSRPINKIKDGVINLGVKVFANSKSRAKVLRYLEQRGRKYGFCIAGNNNRAKKHQKILTETALKILFPKATLFSAQFKVK
jgi:hypothetical protein